MATQPAHVAVGDLVSAAIWNNLVDWLGGVWQAYTPTLTATTTNPTLGTGSSVYGEYVRVGNAVLCRGTIKFGTAAAAAGSGNYAVSLPVTVLDSRDQASSVEGDVLMLAAGVWTRGFATFGTGGDHFNIRYDSLIVGGSNTTVTDAAPGVWTNNDKLSWNLILRGV